VSPARERRTHAERTAETRERVMKAVVDAVAQVGFARTTASEISKRAGVTWGAVQHHFGDKEGILAAVLEASFEHFSEVVGEAPEELELEKRVTLFVERAWLHFGSARYQSTFEILLNLPAEVESPWQELMLGGWQRIWGRWFPESNPRDQATRDVMLYAVAVFTGLATTQNLERGNARGRERHLRYLIETLVNDLEREGNLS
jgi:AcrR family transcriptional regulator